VIRSFPRRCLLALLVAGATLLSVTVVAGPADAHRAPGPGARIIAVAKRYVGHARYVEGGATPRHGFDCSGYTMFAYAKAKVRRLPHNAEAQRRLHGMHRITRSHARPGDLIFYLSGNYAYHVAIYAGHGMQYAAATPRDGIRYQHIWSSHVEFRTSWH
jgi:cell wall-associated NlpC family hydrolase